MDVDGDERLILGSLHSLKVSCGHINQCVEQVQKMLIGFRHDAAIMPGIG